MKFFNLLIVGILVLLLTGCATTENDPVSMIMLSNRIKQLEDGKKLEQQKVLIEIEVNCSPESDIVNMNNGIRKVTIEAILDEDGRLIIPPDKVIRKFELKSEK